MTSGAQAMSGHEPQPDLCIILVGRSPAEQWLRAESSIELRRARSVLDAIGEIGQLDQTASSMRPIVMLAPEILRCDTCTETVLAIRKVEPGVSIVGLGPRIESDAIQLWLDERADLDALRQTILISRQQPRREEDLIDLSMPSSAPAQPQPSRSGATVHLFDDEETILAALMTGADILGPTLDRLRRRLGSMQVRYVPGEPPAESADECAVAVEFRDRRLGTLIGPPNARTALIPAARWLGHWLALREQHSQLRVSAFTDPLTGAWNRRYLDRFLAASLERARTKRHDASLLLFDIDDFKRYNDKYGHHAGDEILREVVRLLNSVVRPTDRVCRIGGDEFAVVFDDPEGPRDPRSRHPSSMVEIARRFQRQIQDHRFPKLGDEARGRLTISGGMATYPWDATDAQSLLEKADALLLESKKQGKNAINIGPESDRKGGFGPNLPG